MIYVTVGGISSYGFLRLVKKMDEMSSDLQQEVIMQIGNTRYIPQKTKYVLYNCYEESLDYIKRADLVIGPCSIGTILSVAMFHKPLIILPRRKLYGELGDEHQLEIANLIESRHLKGIRIVYDTEELKPYIVDMLDKRIGLNLENADSAFKLKEEIRRFVAICKESRR